MGDLVIKPLDLTLGDLKPDPRMVRIEEWANDSARKLNTLLNGSSEEQKNDTVIVQKAESTPLQPETEPDDYVIEQKFGLTTGRTIRAESGVINYRKWNSGVLEYWGYVRLQNVTFNASSWSGLNQGTLTSGGTSTTFLPIWGTWPIPFIDYGVSVDVQFVGADAGYTGDVFILNCGGAGATYLKKSSPNIKYVRGGSAGVIFGHPVHTFRAIGRWK